MVSQEEGSLSEGESESCSNTDDSGSAGSGYGEERVVASITANAVSDEVRTKVSNRLKLVKHVIEHDHPPAAPSGPPGMHPYSQHDSLANYLLLTCFDVLGQRPDFVGFDCWLTAANRAKERELAVASCAGTDILQNARDVRAWYNKRYGVGQAFKRGLLEVVRAADRAELFSGLMHLKGNGVYGDSSDAHKANWMFQLRNGFTHGAEISMKPRNFDGARFAYASYPDGKVVGKYAYEPLHTGKPNSRNHYSVVDWPFILYKCVAHAIDEDCPDFDVKYRVHFSCATPNGREAYWDVSGIHRRLLDDDAERARFLPELAARCLASGPPWPEATILGDEDATLNIDVTVTKKT